MTRWTASMVEERLEEAASTLRRLPSVKVCGYFGVWPEVLHDTNDKRDWEIETTGLGPPSAAAISRMEETLTWFRWLTPEENRLVWSRANGVRWKLLSWRLGCDRTTAWGHWVYALEKITRGLNKARKNRAVFADTSN